jgi:hypothetical protein
MSDIMQGAARMMVRRHMSDLIGTVATEDLLVKAFLRCAEHTPDMPMGTIAQAVRMTILSYPGRQTDRPAYRTLNDPKVTTS